MELAPAVAGLAAQPAESRLLGAAAVAAASRRAGWQPPTDDGPLPASAPVDDRPQVSAQAGWLLRRALDDRPELVVEWLGLAAAARRRPPNDELPRLLGLAARNADARAALAPVVGPRAAWLVEQMPELAAGLTGSVGDPAAAWDAASTPAGRAAVIAALRATDAAVARELLATNWDAATFEERALATSALALGLSPDDIPVLERGWADSRVEVRSAASTFSPGCPTPTSPDSPTRPPVRRSRPSGASGRVSKPTHPRRGPTRSQGSGFRRSRRRGQGSGRGGSGTSSGASRPRAGRNGSPRIPPPSSIGPYGPMTPIPCSRA